MYPKHSKGPKLFDPRGRIASDLWVGEEKNLQPVVPKLVIIIESVLELMKKKRIKIGFDLDGVIIGRPPLVPKKFLERFFRGTKEDGLVYRFPASKINQFLRKLSHYHLFRPPIKDNLAFLEKVKKNPDVEVYLISGRYKFLEKETQRWLERWEINNGLAGLFLNEKNLPPHIFKERIIRELNLDIYLEDDKRIVSFLKRKIPQTKFYWVDDENFDLSNLL